ncbi:MAG TPA: hypothetical protein VNZ58_04165, partial [Thermomicrobiales bacterium]|nr:hypothetical protein [Thermomicrobiales bacterium]
IGSLVDEQALTMQVERLECDHPTLAESLQRAHRIRASAGTSGRLDQVVRFLATTAASAPVVLVLEDLHWAHDSVIAMLQYLYRQLRDKTDINLLVIGSYRPSDLTLSIDEPRHPLEAAINEMERLGGDIVVDLGTTIGPGPGQAFIKSLAHEQHLDGDVEDALAEFLFERTEGHPLFAVELIRWLKAKGMLGNNATPQVPLNFSTIPEDAPVRVQAVITERLARLPQNLREVLEGASVQGPTVAIDLLPNTSDFTGDQVAEAIEDHIAPRFKLLEPTTPTTIAMRQFHRYRFPHIFFQQYLYESLSPSRRERLHARTAGKMIALLGDGPHSGAGDIAFHFAQAKRFDEAATYSSHAGAYALRQLNFEMAEYWFKQAEIHARAVNDEWRALSARNGLIGALRGQINLDEAIILARQVVVENRDRGFHDLEAEASYLLGQMFYDRGLARESAEFLGTSASVYRELGKSAELSRAESMLSHAYYLLGAYDEALRHAYASWESSSTSAEASFGAEGLLAAGNCEVDLGRYETAMSTYARGRAAYRRSHEIRGELYCDLNTGLCLIQLKRYDEAIALLQKTLERTITHRAARIQAVACQYLGLALEGTGDLDAAMASFQEAFDIRSLAEQRGVLCDTIASMLRIDIRRKDIPAITERLKELDRALDIQDGAGIEDPIMVWLTKADAHAAIGSAEDEASALRDGYALLMDRASRITSPEARHSYLTNVPANRTLRERYRDVVGMED